MRRVQERRDNLLKEVPAEQAAAAAEGGLRPSSLEQAKIQVRSSYLEQAKKQVRASPVAESMYAANQVALAEKKKIAVADP